jgi:hypothetical protein
METNIKIVYLGGFGHAFILGAFGRDHCGLGTLQP